MASQLYDRVMRLSLLCVLLGGLLGANLVLFIASTRQFDDANVQRDAVETIAGDMRALYAGCR
jgi:hypothetical protein